MKPESPSRFQLWYVSLMMRLPDRVRALLVGKREANTAIHPLVALYRAAYEYQISPYDIEVLRARNQMLELEVSIGRRVRQLLMEPLFRNRQKTFIWDSEPDVRDHALGVLADTVTTFAFHNVTITKEQKEVIMEHTPQEMVDAFPYMVEQTAISIYTRRTAFIRETGEFDPEKFSAHVVDTQHTDTAMAYEIVAGYMLQSGFIELERADHTTDAYLTRAVDAYLV